MTKRWNVRKNLSLIRMLSKESEEWWNLKLVYTTLY